MKGRFAGFWLASLIFMGTACNRSADRPGPAADAGSSSRDSSPAAGVSATGERPAAEHAGEGHDADGHGADAAGQALLPIMQRLGSHMATLTHALMTDDYQAVERSAAGIAEHVPISAAELERIRRALGPDMPVFEAVDESVHVASVRLRDVARERRLGLVVERLGEVQRGCVSCHAQFRERLRTDSAGRQARAP